MTLPPSIEAIYDEWASSAPGNRPPVNQLVQRIAAEACRLQREADYTQAFGEYGFVASTIMAAPLVVPEN